MMMAIPAMTSGHDELAAMGKPRLSVAVKEGGNVVPKNADSEAIRRAYAQHGSSLALLMGSKSNMQSWGDGLSVS